MMVMAISATQPTFLRQGSMQLYLAYRYRQTGAPVQCFVSTVVSSIRIRFYFRIHA
jgi:hypothetical protein